MEEVIKNFFYNYGYDKKIVENVNMQLDKVKESGYIQGKNNVKLYYEKYIVLNEKGRVVLCHGYCEYIAKFTEMIYYFMKMGYSVYAIEHRGHGRSGSLSRVHKSQINIDKFEYYVEDLKMFLDKIVVKDNTDLYLYAHSMGGAIGAMFLEKYTGYFKKAILSAPMLEIDTGKYPKWMSYCASCIYVAIGKGDKYVFGHRPFKGKYNLEASASSNKFRYENNLKNLRNNEVIQRSGASFNWVFQSLISTKKIINKNNVRKIDIPMLIFQAGIDRVVKPGGQNKFCERAKNCKIVRFEKAKHEIYSENDEILIEYLKEIRKFLKQ